MSKLTHRSTPKASVMKPCTTCLKKGKRVASVRGKTLCGKCLWDSERAKEKKKAAARL